MTRRFKQIPWPLGAALLTLVLALALVSGWQREFARRYPLSNLPYVDMKKIEEQVRSKNLTRTEALFYRKVYAGSDTSQNR